MHILEISKSLSAKTEFSVFFSSVFGFFNTDVGVGFLNIAISVSVTDSALSEADIWRHIWGRGRCLGDETDEGVMFETGGPYLQQ